MGGGGDVSRGMLNMHLELAVNKPYSCIIYSKVSSDQTACNSSLAWCMGLTLFVISAEPRLVKWLAI